MTLFIRGCKLSTYTAPVIIRAQTQLGGNKGAGQGMQSVHSCKGHSSFLMQADSNMLCLPGSAVFQFAMRNLRSGLDVKFPIL